MKQVVFCSRFSFGPATAVSPDPSQEAASALLSRVKAARIRHSACGVSSILVRRGDHLLGVLEGAPAYVDRMWTALAKDGLLDEMHVLAEKPAQQREFSEVALSLVEVESLEPQPSWADKDLSTLDLRTARRILASLRAFHGLHAEPARESHLRSVSVGPLKA